jgi:uncharacterized protein (TIGR02598 family)
MIWKRPPAFSIFRVLRAFSLVEVTMAIGIISVSLLTMLGLIPIGLNGLKSAADDTVRAQVSQHIASKLLLLPYSQIDAYVDQMPLYFNHYAIPQEARNADTRYTVTGQVRATSFPGSDTLGDSSDLSGSICTIQFTITTLSGEKQPYVIHLPNRGE